MSFKTSFLFDIILVCEACLADNMHWSHVICGFLLNKQIIAFVNTKIFRGGL